MRQALHDGKRATMIQFAFVAGERAYVILIPIINGKQSPHASHLHSACRIAVRHKNAFGIHQAQLDIRHVMSIGDQFSIVW